MCSSHGGYYTSPTSEAAKHCLWCTSVVWALLVTTNSDGTTCTMVLVPCSRKRSLWWRPPAMVSKPQVIRNASPVFIEHMAIHCFTGMQPASTYWAQGIFYHLCLYTHQHADPIMDKSEGPWGSLIIYTMTTLLYLSMMKLHSPWLLCL